jgi:beta-phosphoglucomutase-like phosphatase (HAD superfamily)
MLLLDADGNLFPSEEPAIAASTEVVNRMVQRLGSSERYRPEQLRRATLGRTFRSTAVDLAAASGTVLDSEELEHWVAEEKREVTEHLRRTLRPDPEVVGALTRMSEDFELAVVSSSALSRLDACFEVTGLAGLLPPSRRFSAEDSLPTPSSKPDPAVYRFAAHALGIEPDEGLAVEDSVTGAESAVAAGLQTLGNVGFVAPEEQQARIRDLEAAGVSAIVSSWNEVETLLKAS